MTSESHDQHDRANAELILLLREELAQATQEGNSQPPPVSRPVTEPAPQTREARLPVIEHLVPDDERSDIDAWVQAGLARLGVALEASPLKVVQELRTHLDAERIRVNALDHDREEYADVVLELGATWGAQVVRYYGWHWGQLEIDGQEGGTVVIHPEGRVFVSPTRLRWEIVSRPERSNTTALIFGTLAPGVLSAQLPKGECEPGSYTGIHS